MCVAGLRHSPRAAVSPARDGIGSRLNGRTWLTWGGHNRVFPPSWDASGRTSPLGGAATPPYDAVVTIRFVNCARALSTHLPFLGASVTQSFRLGPSLPKRRPHFCRNRRACQSALPHRSAADALDAGEQLRLAGEAAAAVVAHLGEDVANRQGAPRAPH
jgi:hypothetical protein